MKTVALAIIAVVVAPNWNRAKRQGTSECFLSGASFTRTGPLFHLAQRPKQRPRAALEALAQAQPHG